MSTAEERKQLTEMVEYLTLRLKSYGAIAFGDFLLHVLWEYLREHPRAISSVPFSPIYFNFRHKRDGGPLECEDILPIGECMYRMAKASGVWADFVLGVPRGGTMLAEAFAQAAHEDGKYIRVVSFPKDFVLGERMRCDGNGLTAIVIEDVLTFGDSVLDFVKHTIRPFGLKVNACFAFADREQGAMQALTRAGISSFVLSSSSAVVDLLAAHELIDPEMRETVLKYPARLQRFLDENHIRRR